MDSLKARALALALPAALGLFISGSAAESLAADIYPFNKEARTTVVADRDPFAATGTPSSLSFVQRFPAIEAEDSASQQRFNQRQMLRRFPAVAGSTVPEAQVNEAQTTGAKEHAQPRVASYQPPKSLSYTIISQEAEAIQAATPSRSHAVVQTQNAMQQTQSASRQTPELHSQNIESTPQRPAQSFTPVVSVATNRFSNPVVTPAENGTVKATVEQFGKWDSDVCNTPPLHKPVTRLQLNEDEPVIHVINREPDHALKEQFYGQQLAAAELEARQAEQSPVLDLSPSVDAAAQETVDRAGQMQLRQPGSGEWELEMVTVDGEEVVEGALVNELGDGDELNAGEVVESKRVESDKSDPRVARFEEMVVEEEAARAARGTEQGAWSPMDMRSVSIDRPLKEESVRRASQATRADKAQARRAVQLGFELIQRQAHYSARARFIQSLRIVARSMDDQTFTTTHTTALRNALAAYEESVDFYPSADKPDEDVNLHMILGGHDTPVLEDVDTGRLTPRQCVREYMAYAEQEFVAALGRDGFASQALYGLGRLEASKETASASAPQVRANRSLMLYQTAMLVDPRNYAAANELGVLLAKYGKFDTAVAALRHCVMHSPEPTAWKNLANLYRRMGRPADAHMAEMEANNVRARRGAPFVTNQPRVEWVGPEAFVAMNADANVQVARSARGQAGPPPMMQQGPAPRQTVAGRRPMVKSAGKSTRKSLWPFKKK